MKRITLVMTLMTGLIACASPDDTPVYVTGGAFEGSVPRSQVVRQPSGGLLVTGPSQVAARPVSPVLPNVRSVAPQNPPPTAQADAFARNFLDGLQARSFREQREFCGYFIQLPDGQITATPPVRGNFASCENFAPEPGRGIFASYHTHGAYAAQYDSEVPSTTDLLSDFADGIDGYVSTPGGRIWRIEFDTRDAFQVCGQGCVTVDPGFVPEGEAFILSRYTLDDLNRRGI